MNDPLKAAVRFENVHLELGGHPVLQNVSFQVNEGEYCCIIGPNGAGKSTALKCLERFHEGWTGRISLYDRELRNMSRLDIARTLGYVPQIKGHLPDYDVTEFLCMSRYSHSEADSDIVRQAMTQVGLETYAHRLISTLSGGECQKVFIAAGLVQETPVMLLDEPASFLDPRFQEETDRLLKDINRDEKKTVLCVTHDLNAALRDADKIIALKHGKVAFVMTPQDAWNQKALDDVFETSFDYFQREATGRLMVTFG